MKYLSPVEAMFVIGHECGHIASKQPIHHRPRQPTMQASQDAKDEVTYRSGRQDCYYWFGATIQVMCDRVSDLLW